MKLAQKYKQLADETGRNEEIFREIAKNCCWLVFTNADDEILKNKAHKRYQNLKGQP